MYRIIFVSTNSKALISHLKCYHKVSPTVQLGRNPLKQILILLTDTVVTKERSKESLDVDTMNNS